MTGIGGRIHRNAHDAGQVTGVKKLLTCLLADDAKPQNAVTKLTFEEMAAYQYYEVKALLGQCVQRVYEKRLAFQKDIFCALMDRLGQHSQKALSMPIGIVDDAKSNSTGMSVGEKDQNTAFLSEQEKFQVEIERAFEMKYWDLIDDVGNNHEILRMCWDGNMDKEIADALGLIPGSISNVLSIIREDYGDHFTPSSRNRL